MDLVDSVGAASSEYCAKVLKAKCGRVLGLEKQFGLLLGTACYTLGTGASSITLQQDVLDSLEIGKKRKNK